MKLHCVTLGTLLLLLLASCGGMLKTSAIDLRTFIGCATWEVRMLRKRVLEPPYIESYHRVCIYNETKMMTVKLPKCAPDVDPFYTYPVAIRCDCDICSTAMTECETA
uniref:Glycoprotein hormone subunit beta 5 n=1 Tax=Athene cunicularia TaxID=194338 RepID=A0A663LXY4_ATHCN